MKELHYPKEKYENCQFYGDADEDEIKLYKSKVIKVRKEHECSNCQRTIEKGEYAFHESGFIDGYAVHNYVCAECLEEWMIESGQVDDWMDTCESIHG